VWKFHVIQLERCPKLPREQLLFSSRKKLKFQRYCLCDLGKASTSLSRFPAWELGKRGPVFFTSTQAAEGRPPWTRSMNHPMLYKATDSCLVWFLHLVYGNVWQSEHWKPVPTAKSHPACWLLASCFLVAVLWTSELMLRTAWGWVLERSQK
jgi:hypothetical protein